MCNDAAGDKSECTDQCRQSAAVTSFCSQSSAVVLLCLCCALGRPIFAREEAASGGHFLLSPAASRPQLERGGSSWRAVLAAGLLLMTGAVALWPAGAKSESLFGGF